MTEQPSADLLPLDSVHAESIGNLAAEDTKRRATSGLGRIAARGAAITLSGQGIQMIVSVATVVVLAKLLTPHDYGLVSEVLVIAGIANLFRDFGLSSAAVQARSLTTAQRDNLFWLNSAFGLALTLVVAACSHLIAVFYHENKLTLIALVLSSTFVLDGLATQHRASMNRAYRFGQLAMVDIIAEIAGLIVGIVLAMNGAGYWALVVQQVLQSALTFGLVLFLGRWLPRWPTRDAEMKGLLRFGLHLLGTQLVSYITNNIDTITVGRRFGAKPLGFYNRAFQLLMTPLVQVRAPTTTVALPVLARLESEPEKYGRFLVRGQLGLGYSLVAGLAIVGAAAKPIVNMCLGSEWISVVPILRVLAYAGAVSTLSYVGYWVFISRGLTKELLRFTIGTFFLRIVCVLAGSEWGLIGVAWGYAIAPALSAPWSLWWLGRKTYLPVAELIRGYFRILAVAVAAGVAAYLALVALPGLASILAILLAVAVVAAVYGVAAVIARAVRADLAQMMDVVRLVLRRRA